MPEFRGSVVDDTGSAIEDATVELFDIDTTTPQRASTTTDSSGNWAISHSTLGQFDVRITNGSDIVRLRARDRFQVSHMNLNESAANLEALIVTRSEDVASVEVATFEGDRATPADDDLAYISLKLSDSAGNQDEQARLTWQATTVASGGTQDGDLAFSALTNGSLTEYLRLDGSAGTVTIPADTSLILGAGGDASIQYDGTNLIFDPQVVGSGDTLFSNGLVLIGETTNADMTVGLTLNQGASDDQILAGKSSDVSHAMTSLAEADTYFEFVKTEGTSGGLSIRGYKDADGGANGALVLNGRLGEAADTTDTTSSRAVTELNSQVTDGGTNITTVANAGNAFGMRNSGTMRFLVKGNGDIHASDTDGNTALDSFDDAMLLRTVELTSNRKGIIRDEWDEFVKYNERTLIEAGIYSTPRSEGGLLNVSQLLRAQSGAIWQQAKRIMALEQKLEALPEGK